MEKNYKNILFQELKELGEYKEELNIFQVKSLEILEIFLIKNYELVEKQYVSSKTHSTNDKFTAKRIMEFLTNYVDISFMLSHPEETHELISIRKQMRRYLHILNDAINR